MDEQKRADPPEQEQEQELDDLEVSDEQADTVKGGSNVGDDAQGR